MLTVLEMLTRDLRKSNDNLVVSGKLILNLATTLRPPLAESNEGGPLSRATSGPYTNKVATSVTPAGENSNGLRNNHQSDFTPFEDAYGKLPAG